MSHLPPLTLQQREQLTDKLGVRSVEVFDLLVVGSGVAGLSAALASTPRRVALVTKSGLRSGSSPWAQGGIAAAVGEEDSPAEHASDTERVGRGLCDPEVVRLLTDSAPAEIDRLIELGTRFDLDENGELSLGREGGHGRSRILHSGGDATGAEIVRAMIQEVRRSDWIDVQEDCFAIDLVVARSPLGESRVVGAVCLRGNGERVALLAQGVVLATGGLGRIYRHTTNPPEVTGDGIAMAARAGARLVDLEFVQFHPTVLAVGRDHLDALGRSALLTEALRGAGAWLVDENGHRFMYDVHVDGELSPRDLVARTIWRLRQEGHEIFLDLRHIADRLPKHFPTVVETCAQVGLDPSTQPLPVSPAAHYFMGGIQVDGEGRTSLPGLWSCGESSSSGAHGANRLASNSLLEGLVFGAKVAASAARTRNGDDSAIDLDTVSGVGGGGRSGPSSVPPARIAEGRSKLRDLAWNTLGLERDRLSLERAIRELESDRSALGLYRGRVHSREEGELRNMIELALLVAHAARLREESRGSHYRSDFPRQRDSYCRRLPLRLLDLGRLGGPGETVETRPVPLGDRLVVEAPLLTDPADVAETRSS